MSNIEKASREKLIELAMKDQNIEAVKAEKKEYNKEANATIKRLTKEKHKLLENLNQGDLFKN